MYCSQSIAIHLLRGLFALILLAIGIYLSFSYLVIAIACFVGALVLFRGCPMCWVVGLFETIAKNKEHKNE